MLNRSWYFALFYVGSGAIAFFFGVSPISLDPPCAEGIYDNCLGPYNAILDDIRDGVVLTTHLVLISYYIFILL